MKYETQSSCLTVICRTQMTHNLGLWSPPGMQSVAEVLSPPCPSTAANEKHGNHMSSAPYSAYDPGQNGTHWGSSCAALDPRTLWPTSPDRQPLFPLVDQESGALWHHSLARLNVHPSAYPSHATPQYPSLSNDEYHRTIYSTLFSISTIQLFFTSPQSPPLSTNRVP